MGKRDLLFIAVCLSGMIVIGGVLRSSQQQGPLQRRSERLKQSGSEWSEGLRETAAQADAELAAGWREAGLNPTPPALELTRIRRVSLALTGSIPSFEELRTLEEIDPPQRYRWWIDHLLSDERAARHVAERLTRAFVGTENGPFLLYRRSRFRDWLAERLLENQPYDELVRELIAGNGLWTTSPSVNFLTATLDANNDNQPDPIRLAGRTSRSFLGMRIDCLQCHDDNLGNVELGDIGDPRSGTQRDFHQLAAFFCEAKVSVLGIRDSEGEYQVEFLGSDEPEVTPAAPPYLPSMRPADGPLRQQLAAWVTSPQNRPFARAAVNRIWALAFGRPLVEPIDDIPLHPPKEGYPPALETLADDFIENGYNLHRLMRVIFSLQPFQIDSRAAGLLTEEHRTHWAAFPVSRLRPEQMAGSIVQACSLESLDSNRHVFIQLKMAVERGEFVSRYGDTGEDEFIKQTGTITQRLVMMNGDLVKELTKDDALFNASVRIGLLTSDDQRVVETAYQCVLTRLPTSKELALFTKRLKGTKESRRARVVEDIFWVLLNTTEFSCNH